MARPVGKRITFLLLVGLMCILLLFQHHTTDKQFWTSLNATSSQLWHSLWPENTGPCACNRCVTDSADQWFMQRFNGSLNPFLTQNNTLPESAFRWWKNLPFGNSAFGTYRGAEVDVFKIFPDQESFMDARPERCRTCAVVGNSYNLLRSHYGALIDFNDVVMRFNGARTAGYEEDVGNKTTLHLMYPESSVDLDNTTHLLLVPFKTRDLQWLVSVFTTKSVKKTYKPVKSTIKANQGLVKVLHPGFIQHVHQVWLDKSGKYPSTGFLGLMVAMHICDEVNVFGFGADAEGNWRHYWEELLNKRLRTGQHSGGKEYDVIRQLEERQKLNFYSGFL